MATPALHELIYRLWNNYMKNLKENEVVEFNWEKQLPVGRSRLEHNAVASKLITDIIEEHTFNPETSVLICSGEAHIVFALSQDFETSSAEWFGAAYQCGTLRGTAVVVSAGLEGLDTMWLIDVAKNKVIKIKQGKYDYEADQARLLADQGVTLDGKK